MFSESEYLGFLGLILSAVHCKWQLCTTHLGASHPPSGMTPSPSSSAFFLFTFSLLFLLLLSFHLFNSSSFHLVIYILCSLIPQSSSSSPYNCVFSLPSRSQPSHLLNHLVKFVSSENPKFINKRATSKMCNPKINSHHDGNA